MVHDPMKPLLAPVTQEDLKELFKLLDAWNFRFENTSHTELLNEQDPEGPVVMRHPDGSPSVLRDRETWDCLREVPLPLPPFQVCISGKTPSEPLRMVWRTLKDRDLPQDPRKIVWLERNCTWTPL